MAVQAGEYYINDLSAELIALYRQIAASNPDFMDLVKEMDLAWQQTGKLLLSDHQLYRIYISHRLQGNEQVLQNDILTFVADHEKQISQILRGNFYIYIDVFRKQITGNLLRKMKRMRQLELGKHPLIEKDLYDNMEAALKSGLYMTYRHIYNKENTSPDAPVHCALFFFLRNYSYSGMFRYSAKGEFNVPYGGIAYNAKLMDKKLAYYLSSPLLEHFSRAHIYHADFEEFLRQTSPTAKDFIFLDPPYDSEFNTYAQNAFTRDDQVRLSNYLLHECKAKWMLIIKYTDFIYSLYRKPGISIQTFDKEYLVSFMNRNNKNATHLIITNY